MSPLEWLFTKVAVHNGSNQINLIYAVELDFQSFCVVTITMSLESSSVPKTSATHSSCNLLDESAASVATAATATANHCQDAVIGSLGNALAGVTISSSATTKSAFVSGIPSNGAWGGFSNTPSTRNSSSPTTEPPTPEHTERKQSIELFLSRTPSEMLGNDVLKELSTANLSDIAIPEDGDRGPSINENLGPSSAASNFPNNFGAGTTGGGTPSVLQPSVTAAVTGDPPSQHHEQRHHEQRLGSPSTGTTISNTTGSRSNSPYDKGNNTHGSTHTIKAYDPSSESVGVYQPIATGTAATTNSHMKSTDSSPCAPQSHNNYHNTITNLNYNPQYNLSSHVTKHHVPTVNDGPNASSIQIQQQLQNQHPQQILYMAVPTPDGRQVLQPVQMVQMLGKQFTYVLPGTEGIPSMQGAIPPQPMMVLPAMIPQQGQLGLPMGHQQQGMQGHQANNLNGNENTGCGGGRRNNRHQNKSSVGSIRYQGLHNDINGSRGGSYSNHITSPVLGTGDFSGLQGQGGIENDPQYLNQPADPTLASLYSTPQRPPLDALLGHIRKLSRDQVGCRVVQQALDEEGPMAATLILNEGLPFWGEAMIDPFGNYLFQKILEKITAEERIMLVKSVSSRLVNSSLNLHGTRSVQKIVELCTIDEQSRNGSEASINGTADASADETACDVLTKSLTPAAARLCIDSHGNHVIQRILLKLGLKHSKFVFDAVAESVGDVARHRHGCCVIQRCLDSSPGPARSNLVRHIVDKSLELMQDAYGNYVVQYVLDVCSDDDVHAVCESVIGKVNLLAIQKFSSNVMEKCLERCTDRVKERYMQELSDPERIRELMMDPFGNYVVQRALSVATHTQAVRLVEAMKPHLKVQIAGTADGQRNGGVRNTAGGRRIMAKICRRFPNFNIESTGTREEIYSQNRARNQHHNNHHNQNQNSRTHAIYSMPQISPAPVLEQQPQHIYAASQNLSDYGATPIAMNPLNMGSLQFDQRQSYYDVSADTGYFQQQQAPFGQGAYPNDL